MHLPQEPHDFYKDSPMREGILCWYPFASDAKVLDLSHGALTDLLRRQCAQVTSDKCVTDEKFDYIIAIDLEDFGVGALQKLKNSLKPHGRLLLAFENPFALRYWAGKRNEKTGLPYDSLFGRGNVPSKAELTIRLKQAGFEGQKWYYPLTDHWFTREVYSENYLPDEYLNQRFIPYVADNASLQFDEQPLYREIIRGGAFEFMCGAYLVEARGCTQDKSCEVDYAAVTAYREPSKRFATTVRTDGTVRKTPLHHDSKESLLQILRNHEDLDKIGVNVIALSLKGETISMPRMNIPTLWDYWVKKLINGTFDENEMFRQFDRIRKSILRAATSGKCYWELVPANCFYDAEKDELIFFDQEYYWENVSPDVAVARAVCALKYSPAFKDEPRAEVWLEQLKSRYGLDERWEDLINFVDVKSHSEVFGDGTQFLEQETERAVEHIATRAASVRRYWRFFSIVKRLESLNLKRPVIYGWGLRGKALLHVLSDSGIQIVAIVDKRFYQCKIIEDILLESAADVVIVSILGGEEIAADLRGRVNIPVYTLGELINEQA